MRVIRRYVDSNIGEALVDEHNAHYENPLKFSGKELDEITGLYDHGARNRNPISTLWYGIDPLFEKYPDYSPYNYCAGNPVRLVDPDGRANNPFDFFNGFSFDFVEYVFSGSPLHIFYQRYIAYNPPRNRQGAVVIDHTNEAVLHYYQSNGESVSLGPNTQKEIMNSKDVNYFRDRIVNGKTASPASGSVGINMEPESWASYHVGSIPLKYKTVCNSEYCTTTYTVEGDGFWDIFWGEDHDGPKGELGGTPYKYNSFSWSETYKNPGYPVDENGVPSQNPLKVEEGSGPPNKKCSSSSEVY